MAEVIIVKNQEEAGELYGRSVADLIKAKPNAVLGLATGSSPLAAYQALAKIVEEESIDVSQVQGFALDEYIGLPLTHPESYHATIHRTVVEPLGLDPAKVHVPGDVLNGTSLEDGEKVAGAGAAYDAAIEAAGGIDVQILGIGTDGHVGFNEPGSSLASGTRVKTLTERTRIDNARFFDNDINQVPTHCITQGIGTIMKARHLVLLAFGAGKAEAVGGDRGGRHQLVLPGLGAPDAPARHDHRGRGGRQPPAQQGLLPVLVRAQAGLADDLTARGPGSLRWDRDHGVTSEGRQYDRNS